MKVVTNHIKDNEIKHEYLHGGDVVFCQAEIGADSFYGLYAPGVGIIDLEYGSSAYMACKDKMYIGQKVNYWTIIKVYKNSNVVIKD